MTTNKVFQSIEDSIIQWYSDFQNLHDLRDENSEYLCTDDMDRSDDLLKCINDIVCEDLYGHHKKDELLHYIIVDVERHLDWNRITSDLFDVYFC